jgi:mycothiol synthase
MVKTLRQIIRCPLQRVGEALSLVLCDVSPAQQAHVAAALLEIEDPADFAGEALYVAVHGDELRGAAWGQRQSGRVATFWPPQLVPGESEETAHQLAAAVVADLDDTSIEMTQVLLPTADLSAAPLLAAVGFDRLADLLYLTCEAERFPTEQPASQLEFIPYDGSERRTLMRLVERTYEQTLDCVGLNGMRSVDEVITGYQGTGKYRPENWLIVRGEGRDIGLVLLTEHPPARHWELMYMGLVPEVRGRGWGLRVTQHAAWLAHRAGIERIVLAVDAANTPALRMYRLAGFEIWDRRSVYVRFPPKTRRADPR